MVRTKLLQGREAVLWLLLDFWPCVGDWQPAHERAVTNVAILVEFSHLEWHERAHHAAVVVQIKPPLLCVMFVVVVVVRRGESFQPSVIEHCANLRPRQRAPETHEIALGERVSTGGLQQQGSEIAPRKKLLSS